MRGSALALRGVDEPGFGAGRASCAEPTRLLMGMILPLLAGVLVGSWRCALESRPRVERRDALLPAILRQAHGAAQVRDPSRKCIRRCAG